MAAIVTLNQDSPSVQYLCKKKINGLQKSSARLDRLHMNHILILSSLKD